MFKAALDKYYAVKYSVKLRPNENFGIIVSDSWNHTFLVIKHVLPNSKAQMLGLKPKDRICMVDNECHPQLNSKKLDLIFKSKLSFLMTILRKRGSYKGYEIPEPMEDGKNYLPVNYATFVSKNQLRQKQPINFYRDPNLREDNQMDIDDADSWNVSSTCGSFQDHLDLERHNVINNRQNSQIYNTTFQCANFEEANRVDQWLGHNHTAIHRNQIMSESFLENKENYQPLRMMSGHSDLRGMYAQHPDNMKHICCNKSEVKNRIFEEN